MQAGTPTAVAVAGRLDAVEAGPLRATLAAHLANGTIWLIVDLSAATFIDSAGLAALVQGMKGARAAGGDLVLVRPAAADALRIFSLTKFDEVFEMYPSLELANSSAP